MAAMGLDFYGHAHHVRMYDSIIRLLTERGEKIGAVPSQGFNANLFAPLCTHSSSRQKHFRRDSHLRKGVFRNFRQMKVLLLHFSDILPLFFGYYLTMEMCHKGKKYFL